MVWPASFEWAGYALAVSFVVLAGVIFAGDGRSSREPPDIFIVVTMILIAFCIALITAILYRIYPA